MSAFVIHALSLDRSPTCRVISILAQLQIGLPLNVTLETFPSARKVERLTARPSTAVTESVLTTWTANDQSFYGVKECLISISALLC